MTKENKKKTEKIVEVKLKREPGYLYYIDKEGDISRVSMGRIKKSKQE